MFVGINHPWKNYGWDLGPAVQAIKPSLGPPNITRWDSPVPSSSQTLLDYQLANYKDLGIEVVRWIILGDGWNLGPAKYQSGKWTYDPPNLAKSQFCNDFAKMLGIFAKNKMKLFPSLINHLFVYPAGFVFGTDLAGKPHNPTIDATFKGSKKSYGSIAEFVDLYFKAHPLLTYDETQVIDWTKFIKGGKAAIVSDPTTSTAFINNIVSPLLDVAANFPDQIYAIELFSEPDLAVDQKYVKAPAMYDLLTRGCATIIGRRNFKASIGFQLRKNWDTMHSQTKAQAMFAQWTGTKQFIPQIHYYPASSDLTPLEAATLGMIVGEFAITTGKLWPGETSTTASVTNRLDAISQGGYAGALPWSAYADDEYSKWSVSVQQEISDYIDSN